MSLDSWFEQVWDALVTQVKGITEFGAAKVFYGKKNPITQFPAAYIQPATADGLPKTWRETAWSPTFNIYVVTENADTKAGVLQAWKLSWKIIEALQVDRTLGGLLHNLECGPVLDSPEGMGRGIEQNWTLVQVKCSKKL